MSIAFEVATGDFDHAVKICEVTFGYSGIAWNMVKDSGDWDELADFLEQDGVDEVHLFN